MTEFTLFEISWEVAHRVGGIHTVVSTKARSLVERLGDDYVVIGPWLPDHHDPDAVLDPVGGYADFEEECRAMGIPVRVGRWRVPGRPLTVLVEFSGLYTQKDSVLAGLWTNHQVDSLRGDWDYVEPVLFGNAAGMVIERWWRDVVRGTQRAGVAQAHEWMTGSALLYLKDHVPGIGTVFTAHATVIGRAAAALGRIGAAALGGRSPEAVATELGVPAKHSMESCATRVADVFTAVSEIASAEALRFHGRAADPVLPNGLDPEVLAERVGGVPRNTSRAALRNLASRFLGEDVGDAAIICSGARYEFHNKGFDLLLDAAADLNAVEGRSVVLFLLVPAGNSGLKRTVTERLAAKKLVGGPPLGVALHNLFDPENDPIAQRCKERGLDNAHGRRVKVIHWADYVGPDDGVLNLRYEAVLQGADATCFPSYYESWGYTPQESLALGAPTVTTDLAGFGLWVKSQGFGPANGVHVLARDGRKFADITVALTGILEELCAPPADEEALLAACREVARATYWDRLLPAYDEAHEKALSAALERASTAELPAGRAPRFRLPVRQGPQVSRPHVFELSVPSELPETLAGLDELARNWWWTWDAEAAALFEDVCPATWARVRHAPLRLLSEAPTPRLTAIAADDAYLARMRTVLGRLRTYCAAAPDERAVTVEHPVAYVCAEFGVHESMPIYSGGLGVLAGDHLRAASDQSLPLVAVGLLYRAGYMRQQLRAGAEQHALPDKVDPRDLPLEPVTDAAGDPVEISVGLPGSEPLLRAWRTAVGRVTLYLLDSDVLSNRPEDREITRALYSGDQDMRIRQEIVLGLGSVRLLTRLGIEPSVYHVNEGHGAFAALERVRMLLKDTGLTADEAHEAVRATTVFTTHTPVPAGHDEFPEDLVRRYFGSAAHVAGVPWERFMALGASTESPGRFNMTGLAVRFAARVNAVSKEHARVSRALLRRFSPQLLREEMPIHSITNGVHLAFWTRPPVLEALPWPKGASLSQRFAACASLDLARVWEMRRALRTEMHTRLVAHLRRSFAAQGDSPALLERIEARLDPDALYVGFARRFATYKRAGLVFREPERLLHLLDSAERPVVLLIAGKAHPRDTEAQELIARIGRLARDPRFVGRLVLIENYDVEVARWLVSGVDVWLNNPRPPLEASGTSGMKAAANGVLNLSVGDGWWLEGYDPGGDGVPASGWRIGIVEDDVPDDLQDARDAASLYGLLENEVIPEFFERDEHGVPAQFLGRVRRALATIPPVFSAERMVAEYREWAYEPLAVSHAELCADRWGVAQARFRDLLRVRRALEGVRIVSASVGDTDALRPGAALEIGVDVDLGELLPREVHVEALLGLRDDVGELRDVEIVELACASPAKPDLEARPSHLYLGQLVPASSGAYGYAVRVRPARDGAVAFDDPVVWA